MPRLRLPGALVAVQLLSLAGCASTPPPDPLAFERAETALQQARAADAGHFAPVELRMAEEALGLAQAGSEGRRREVNVGRALELAEVHAELARVKSEGSKLREQVAAAERENAALERELLSSEDPR